MLLLAGSGSGDGELPVFQLVLFPPPMPPWSDQSYREALIAYAVSFELLLLVPPARLNAESRSERVDIRPFRKDPLPLNGEIHDEQHRLDDDLREEHVHRQDRRQNGDSGIGKNATGRGQQQVTGQQNAVWFV
jgi:hypothetical protein